MENILLFCDFNMNIDYLVHDNRLLMVVIVSIGCIFLSIQSEQSEPTYNKKKNKNKLLALCTRDPHSKRLVMRKTFPSSCLLLSSIMRYPGLLIPTTPGLSAQLVGMGPFNVYDKMVNGSITRIIGVICVVIDEKITYMRCIYISNY